MKSPFHFNMALMMLALSPPIAVAFHNDIVDKQIVLPNDMPSYHLNGDTNASTGIFLAGDNWILEPIFSSGGEQNTTSTLYIKGNDSVSLLIDGSKGICSPELLRMLCDQSQSLIHEVEFTHCIDASGMAEPSIESLLLPMMNQESISTMSFNICIITPASLKLMSSLKSLESLAFNECVTGDDAAFWSDLKGLGLTEIKFSRMNIGNAMSMLTSMHTLQQLELSGPLFRENEGSIGLLSELKLLRRLKLQNVGLSSQVLKEIARLQSIEELELATSRYREIDYDDLLILSGMKHLQVLDLGGYAVDPKAIKEFESRKGIVVRDWNPKDE